MFENRMSNDIVPLDLVGRLLEEVRALRAPSIYDRHPVTTLVLSDSADTISIILR